MHLALSVHRCLICLSRNLFSPWFYSGQGPGGMNAWWAAKKVLCNSMAIFVVLTNHKTVPGIWFIFRNSISSFRLSQFAHLGAVLDAAIGGDPLKSSMKMSSSPFAIVRSKEDLKIPPKSSRCGLLTAVNWLLWSSQALGEWVHVLVNSLCCTSCIVMASLMDELSGFGVLVVSVPLTLLDHCCLGDE